MSADRGLEREVATAFIEAAPGTEPDHLYASIVNATGRVRPRPRWLALIKEPPMRYRSHLGSGSPTLRLASVLATAMALVLALGAAAAVGASLTPSPPPPSETMVPLETTANLNAGVRYTSDLFTPRVSFVLGPYGGDLSRGDSDWCLGDGFPGYHPATSRRTLVLAYQKACLMDLRLIRPYAVDCGTPDTHPDAATLAAAILGNPGMGGARDDGDLSAAAAMAPGMELSGYQGRVLAIEPSLGFAPDPDPDHCRLLPEPGSDDPAIEIRGDVSSVLFLIDVRGELVVVRMSPGGYDATTGKEAWDRGYATGDFGAMLPNLLASVRDFRFE